MTSTHSPVAYTPSVEAFADDEGQTTADIDATMAKIREKTFADGGHAIRSVHAKTQGVLRARLIVEPGLPEALAQGLFAAPGNYDALLRFSTIPGDVLDDRVSVPRGLGLKKAYSAAIAHAVDDGMFFSPWRGLAAHQPLGNVMRARKIAYEHSAQFRAARNGVAVVEPRDLSAVPR